VTDLAAPLARRFVGVRGLRRVAVLLAALLVFPMGSAAAGVAPGPLHVAVQVLPHVRLVATRPDPGFLVTPADIARGYVDVRRHYQLRTNALERVAVQIHPRSSLADAVDVAGLDGPLRLVGTSLEVAAPGRRELDLSFRLWLNAAVTPGTYPLPLQLAAIVR
jgi:hypothetical protein